MIEKKMEPVTPRLPEGKDAKSIFLDTVILVKKGAFVKSHEQPWGFLR
jgi:hypothetical protein